MCVCVCVCEEIVELKGALERERGARDELASREQDLQQKLSEMQVCVWCVRPSLSFYLPLSPSPFSLPSSLEFIEIIAKT